MTTDIDVVNNALEMISAQNTISSFSDGSPEAAAAAEIYQPQVALLLRQYDWDFARKENLSLTNTGNTAPYRWANEWLYPSDGIKVRTVFPNPGTILTYDPQPLRWAEGTAIVSSVATKVLWSSLTAPVACVYTWNAVGYESYWDSTFTQAVTCKVASVLAMAIAGRPDFHKELLEEVEMWAQAGASQTY